MRNITSLPTALLLVAFFCSFSGKTLQAQCTNTKGTFSDGGTVTLFDHFYYYGSTSKTLTTLYEVSVPSTSKDYSHILWALASCYKSSAIKEVGTWAKNGSTITYTKETKDWKLGNDPSHPANVNGLKRDKQLNKGGTYRFYIVFNSDYALTSNWFYVKPGKNFDSARVCGADDKCGAVPIKLIHLDATRIFTSESFYDSLSWITATELNNKQFRVQFSKDGKNWINSDTIKTKAEGGNSAQLLHYSHNIHRPVPSPEQKLYYRLRQVDHDGTTANSFPVAVKLKLTSKAFGFQMYPNPGATVNVVLQGVDVYEEKILEIKNPLGQTIITRTFIGTRTEITTDELAKMAPGTYSTTVSYAGFIKTQKLIVKH